MRQPDWVSVLWRGRKGELESGEERRKRKAMGKERRNKSPGLQRRMQVCYRGKKKSFSGVSVCACISVEHQQEATAVLTHVKAMAPFTCKRGGAHGGAPMELAIALLVKLGPPNQPTRSARPVRSLPLRCAACHGCSAPLQMQKRKLGLLLHFRIIKVR